ncbi:hypothetical protein [Microcystis sp. M_OC_Ca_00000000_S217Cul]|uniref:hypothetical protein n=1 Tax=Microcystis sp. M_OC_Ca_00000000_S217Cul TaxID=2486214 RepID=UPI00257BACD2|nr:hypothetical protein [Microcystis sp. M_OC_Ca_00000000_S217Cul]
MPETDADFSTRWRLIKSYFSRQCHSQYQVKISTSRQHKGENGLVNAPKDWQHSSFHRYVEEGIYDQMWGASERLIFDSDIGME